MLTSRRSTSKLKTSPKEWATKTRVSWTKCFKIFTALPLGSKPVAITANAHKFQKSMSSPTGGLGFSFARRFCSSSGGDYISFQTLIKGQFLASSSRWEMQPWTTPAFIPRIMKVSLFYLELPPMFLRGKMKIMVHKFRSTTLIWSSRLTTSYSRMILT